ncbi:amino acid/amide ABC transporter membrane protein 1, HAAT family [Psychromonas ingrahamii 37]|uniref:Amino acid/amide ABC transporter membrane protein 1, HAAT family n=1 Tax=Psychromonas ingrahamii (strain DSM 17664 / CCUG 51855 / 37) TaxID=357804 RepID=A1SYX4_PSYIN|nr:urea ABC transporter permease subunit UrtB [Psychromonas ingrahamii]ABM04689.1 amino acid/amide ABC transporter membrane protein 1, HAAT family [Psychromonas ingrahamii 37]
MLRIFSLLVFSCMSWFALAENAPATESNTQFETLLAQLPSTKLSKMAPLVDKIAAQPSPQVPELLQHLMEGELYYLKAANELVYAQPNQQQTYDLTSVLKTEALAPVSIYALKKIRTNNRIRGQIRDLLANMYLSNSSPAVRLQAIKQLLDNPSKTGITSITRLIKTEQEKEIRELMSVVLLIEQLEKGQTAEKLAAISQLEGRLEPTVKNALVKELKKLSASQDLSISQDKSELHKALTRAIGQMEQDGDFYQLLDYLFFGLSMGSVLLLAAIGLTITFGVMGVINMAHGEMMMLGAYTTYVIQQTFPNLIEYSLLMAVPAAFLVSGLVGVLIERGVIRFLKGRPLETLLATFGISLILQQLVRTVFSPLNRQVEAPQWMSGSLEINPIFSLTYNRLYIIIFALMVFFSLLMILKKSSLGLHVRAVSQNRDMARALSIKSSWVDAITFGLGSGVAGIAGVALSQLTNVGPNLGQDYIIDSFLVVVFGGVGSLWGTLVAAMTLGTFNKFLEPSMGPVLANIIVLVGLVLFIQKRPKGLFPQKGRSAE